MTDEPTALVPTPEPGPVPPAPVRFGPRDVALGAIVFVAVLALLLGATRLIENGGTAAGPSPSDGLGAGPSANLEPAASATPAGSSASASAGVSAEPSGPPSAEPTPAPSGDPVLVGAGDIGDCGETGDEETAKLLDDIEGTVFTLGDNAYGNGTADQFARCYDPNWGRQLARTRPAPGNHDWGHGNLDGYFGYYGEQATGPDGASWYSYDLGTWHVIVLDSSCDDVGGCDVGSPQMDWLTADLAASDARCTVAYWHHPRWSSGFHGDHPSVGPFWQALYDAGADLILNGHDHDYERFAPQDPSGKEDRDRGIREFVVGTGGTNLRVFESPKPNSELRAQSVHGVIAITLRDGSYDWDFIAAGGDDFGDSGTAHCH
jgi:hypothetical protein